MTELTVLAIIFQAVFVGFGTAIGSYLAQKTFLKSMEERLERLENKATKNS